MTISQVIASRPSLYLLLCTQRLVNTIWINKDQGETREREGKMEREGGREKRGESKGEKKEGGLSFQLGKITA